MKKFLGVLAVLNLMFTSLAFAAKNTEKCQIQIFSNTAVLTVMENVQNGTASAILTQNGQVTLNSNDVTVVRASSLLDLHQQEANMAVSMLRYEITKQQAADISSIVSYEINKEGNSEDANGATLVIVNFKSTEDQLRMGQIGMAQTVCE